MYIDPKDLSLQDAAGMQLANIIRQIPEGGGGSGSSVVYAKLTFKTVDNVMTITCDKMCSELIDNDTIVFYTETQDSARDYWSCVNWHVPGSGLLPQFRFVIASPEGGGGLDCITLTGTSPTDHPSATIEMG